MSRGARALGWIARLPLLGEPELALLLGVHEAEARSLRHALEREGWVEWVVPGSDALRKRRLSFVPEAALTELARALGTERAELPEHAPVRRADVLDRVVRVETAAAVNRFLAELAASPGAAGAVLDDARSLPLAGPARGRWWPPGVEGYGRLRAGALHAPFFLAWDRAVAPDLHRRRRASGWAGPAPAELDRRRAEGPAPLLLVCPRPAARPAWERALVRAAECSERPRRVLLADAREVRAAGPAGAAWRDPVDGREGTLREQLRWVAGPAPGPPWPGARIEAPGGPARSGALRRWAPGAATSPAATDRERTAAVALTTDGEQKRMLEWVGRWPLLTAPQLADLAELPEGAVTRRLGWLLRTGAVRLDGDVVRGEPPAPRLLLTPLGLRFLARRDGVPPGRYARLGGVSAPVAGAGEGPAPQAGATGPIRHRAHALGVNRTVAGLASDARRAGGWLASCRNEAQSTRRFRHEGRAFWIRPDGSGVVVCGADWAPFLLEYDRGTLDAGDFAAKLRGYERYFAAGAWREDWSAAPAVLFVCTDDGAEERVIRAVRRAGRVAATRLPVLVTTEWRAGRDPRNAAGFLGPVWRCHGGDAPRVQLINDAVPGDARDVTRATPGGPRFTTRADVRA